MRAFLGALFGLVVASAAVAALGVALGGRAFWAVIVGGVAAGLVMRVSAATSGMPYLKGGLAALAAAAAAVLGPVGATEYFRSVGAAIAEPEIRVVGKPAGSDDGEADPDAPAAGIVAAEGSDSAQRPIFGGPAGAGGARGGEGPFPGADIACLVIGCLAAYQLGKGSAPADPQATDSEEPPVDPAAEGAGEYQLAETP